MGKTVFSIISTYYLQGRIDSISLQSSLRYRTVQLLVLPVKISKIQAVLSSITTSPRYSPPPREPLLFPRTANRR